jgi:aspartate racemase
MKNNTLRKKTICILGGMGPQASARLLSLMVIKASEDFELDGHEFPEIIVDSIPVPDFISDLKNRPVALRMLRRRVDMLNTFEPDCFAIACNTAHILFDDLKNRTSSPFVSLIEEVSRCVAVLGLRKVGVLATPVTVSSGLYQDSLKSRQIQAIIPSKNQLKQLDCIIRLVLAQKAERIAVDTLLAIANSLRKKGAQGIILGCTELPLVFPSKFNLPVFDCLEILSKALLTRFNGRIDVY